MLRTGLVLCASNSTTGWETVENAVDPTLRFLYGSTALTPYIHTLSQLTATVFPHLLVCVDPLL